MADHEPDFDSEICGADGSRDVNGDCNVGIRWDAETQQWIIAGTINASGTISGGVSGTGTAGNIPKWSGTSTLTNSLASDDGTNFTVGGNFKVNDTLFVDTVTERVGVGTTTPTANLHVKDSGVVLMDVESTSALAVQWRMITDAENRRRGMYRLRDWRGHLYFRIHQGCGWDRGK